MRRGQRHLVVPPAPFVRKLLWLLAHCAEELQEIEDNVRREEWARHQLTIRKIEEVGQAATGALVCVGTC
jgi:hypothetical protein